MTEVIRQKLWNIELVVDDIKQFPQTYKTILGDLCSDGTCQFVLRRKMNKLCKDGVVFKTTIPGTRFGQCIYYMPNKKYYILVEGGRIGSQTYCFFDYKRISQYYIEIKDCWHLDITKWINCGKKIFFEGNILKFI